MQFPKTLSLVHPLASDALYLFYTREFYAQNPNSLTATLFRVLFYEDVKGVLVVLYKTNEVDILAISDANYQKFKQFQSHTVRVLQVYKTPGQETPAGFAEVLTKLCECSSVEHADDVYSNLTKTISERLGGRLVGKAAVPEYLYHIPDVLFPQIKQGVSEAQKNFISCAEQLCRKAPRLSTDRITYYLEVVEKSYQFSSFQPTNAAFSITTTIQEGVIYRGLNTLRTGFSNVSEMKDQKFQAIYITVCSRGALQMSIGRMVFVCKDEHKKELQLKLDYVAKLHEQSMACICDGKPVSDVYSRIVAHWADSGLKVVEKLSGMTLAGYSYAGICLKSYLTQYTVDMALRRDDSLVLDANTPILCRTSVMLELAGNQFVCSFCDSVMPAATQSVSEKSLTSPVATKSSVSEYLREYYVVKEIYSTYKYYSYPYHGYYGYGYGYALQAQQPARRTESQRVDSSKASFYMQATNVDSSSEESAEEVDILAYRRANQAKKRMLLDRHAELREAVYEQMLRRLPTQKLICDDEDAYEIYIAYKEVEDMPRGLQFSRNTFLAGEKMFFYINGRPVPFLPAFFHSVQVSGDDKKVIKIRFIAPGYIAGRKEYHVQLEQYREYSYIKEITLETQNYAVASKIVERLEKIKTQTDIVRKSETADVYSFPEFDCDNLMQPVMKEFLTQQDTYIPLRSQQYQCQVGSSTISQPLEMRPKIKMAQAGTGRRDQGDLSICENGIKYRYAAAGQQAIELFMPFRMIRRIFYEKFRDNQHVCVISFMFYRPVRIEDCLIDKNAQKFIQTDSNYHERFTYLCSMETQLYLGMGRERDEMIQEQETRVQMKKSNIKFDEFFSKLDYQVVEWCKTVLAEAQTSAPLPENPRPYVCQVSKRSRALSFLGSVEQKGQQSVYSYDPGCIGVFNGKVQRSIDMQDVQIAVFENVNYSTHNAFYIAFVFKDVRVEPYVIRQVQFDNITEIQEFLTMNGVYYIEMQDSFVWAEARKRFNASRDEYYQFVEQGGWLYELGDVEASQSASYESEDAYTESASYEYSESSASYSASSAVASESVKESEGDYSVYDWSRSDS